jgi:nicotinate-nucleotide adenylyltransferase
MRIGIFGGSFDPVHVGHLIVAECCREQAGLDRVIFMPAATPPHKQDRILADARHRVAMLALATGGHPAFSVSTDEIDRGGVSYTVETLERLRARHAADDLLLLLGPDALADLPNWREPERIIGMAGLIAVERAGIDDIAAALKEPRLAALLGDHRMGDLVGARICCPAIGIRSSDLRAAVAAGRSIRYRTPRAVEQYIAAHGLYRGA